MDVIGSVLILVFGVLITTISLVMWNDENRENVWRVAHGFEAARDLWFFYSSMLAFGLAFIALPIYSLLH